MPTVCWLHPRATLQFHDFEHACEDYFCNAIGPDYAGTVCQAPPSPPKPPPPPVWPSSAGDDGMSSGAIAGVVIGCILGFLLLGFVVYLVTQERAGTPVFSSPKGVPKAT